MQYEAFDECHPLVMPEPNSGCWFWLGADSGCKRGFPYPRIFRKHDGRTIRSVARWQMIMEEREPPPGMNPLHSCDTPLCINPAHLYAGTQKQNMRDRRDRGRYLGQRGEDNGGGGKLTASDVLAIRVSTERHAHIAPRYGVTPEMIGRIRARKAWRHI